MHCVNVFWLEASIFFSEVLISTFKGEKKKWSFFYVMLLFLKFSFNQNSQSLYESFFSKDEWDTLFDPKANAFDFQHNPRDQNCDFEWHMICHFGAVYLKG